MRTQLNLWRNSFAYRRRLYSDRILESFLGSRGKLELEKNFVFMHIPKAGGSSTREFFSQLFSAKSIFPETGLSQFPSFESLSVQRPSLFMGHLGFEFANNADAEKATLLRHPAERVLSVYSYSVSPGKNRPLIGGLPNGISLLEFLESESEQVQMNIQNTQTWQLAYGYSRPDRRRFGRMDKDVLGTALENLDKVEHLGVIEQFDRFKHRFCDFYQVGLPPDDIRLNVSSNRLNYKDLSAEERSALDSCIELDMVLYEAVLKRV